MNLMQTINPTHFIEQLKYPDGEIAYMRPAKINIMEWSLRVSILHGYETIAIFKVYPHPKPMFAQYDYDLKTTIVE